MLVGLIGERFPGHGILGEEYGSRDASNEYVWVYICRDGKIVEIEEHTDSQRFKEIVLS